MNWASFGEGIISGFGISLVLGWFGRSTLRKITAQLNRIEQKIGSGPSR